MYVPCYAAVSHSCYPTLPSPPRTPLLTFATSDSSASLPSKCWWTAKTSCVHAHHHRLHGEDLLSSPINPQTDCQSRTIDIMSCEGHVKVVCLANVQPWHFRTMHDPCISGQCTRNAVACTRVQHTSHSMSAWPTSYQPCDYTSSWPTTCQPYERLTYHVPAI